MLARADCALRNAAHNADNLLAAGAHCAAAARAAAHRKARISTKTHEDTIEEADTNTKQLAAWAALANSSGQIPTPLQSLTPFQTRTPTHCLITCVAPMLQTHDEQTHRLYTANIDATRSSVSGQGLLAFDPSEGHEARQQNVIRIVPRDADGNLADWVTPDDIRLVVLSPSADTTLTFEVAANGEGWTVAYVCYGSPTDIVLQLSILNVTLWQGSLRVWQMSVIVRTFILL